MKSLTVVTIILSLFIGSCATYAKLPMTNLYLGMTKSQVYNALGRDPDNVIGAKEFPSGTIEVVQYTRHTATNYVGEVAERYWLYFLNDSLRQWGRPGDWGREADKIYEIRYR